jgi:MFS family permease
MSPELRYAPVVEGSSAVFNRFGVFGALQHRDFRLLWIGTTISTLGDGFFLIALAWQVYDISPSPGSLAAVGIAWTLPQVLLLLPTGVLADRMDRRHLMIAGDLLRALAVGAMAALSLFELITVEMMMALAIVVGVGDALFIPSVSSIVPSLLPEDDLLQATR